MAPVRTNLLAAVLIGLASVAAAQRIEPVPRLQQFTQSNPPFLRFKIAEGRIILGCRNLNNFQTQSTLGLGRTETINVGNENGRPTLHYDRTAPNEQFTLDSNGSNGKISIRRIPRGKSKFDAVEFHQGINEKTTLTLGAGDHRRVFQAASFWQLAILQPKECQEHLFPLLELLRPDWKIAATVGRVEKSLVAHARDESTADRKRWAVLVEQLGDDQFTKREAADRALRAGAASALTYLRQLDVDRLDAEQQFRVRRIIAKLAGSSEDDSPDAVGASLQRSPAVWLALLDRPDVATRKTAARQLTALLGEPIDVDPAADPKTQESKREQLRKRIEKKK